jgi:hypothetical protein
VADIEARMSTVEYKVDEHGKRIDDIEKDVDCVKKDCTEEKVTMSRLELIINQSIEQNKGTMNLLKWVVIVALAVISAVTGIKFVIPSM